MKPFKLVIVGGVAGGATAAARARRLDERAEIIVFERGEYVSFANCGLPYYVGETIRDRDRLMVTTPQALKKRYRIDVRTATEVLAIDCAAKRLRVKNLKDGSTYQEQYDRLILSPGAEPIKPPVEQCDLKGIFSLRNIPDTDRIKAFIDIEQPESAVVVGGGFIGLEMVENLAARGIQVTVIEMAEQVMAPLDFEMAALVHAHLLEKGVHLELNTGVSGFSQAGGRIVVRTGSGKELACDMVLLAVGVRPESRLAVEAGLSVNERGGIQTDAAMRTSDPHIFAVGDAAEVKDFVCGRPAMIPLAGPANKQGRIAADNAMGRTSLYRGTQGTSIVKIFDLSVASTGLNEKTMQHAGISYLKSYSDGQSHASYYPGSELMILKLLYSPADGRLLGAQIVGGKGVDKRIDVLATAIRGRMTVYDLEELELAYAPPFSSAKDPVNVAGFHAVNILKGDVQCVHWHQLNDFDPETTVLVDVREEVELAEDGNIAGAIHIPIDELRDRIETLDRTKTYILICLAGLRSYIACRILGANGFNCLSLSGGYGLYRQVMKNGSTAA
jgi:NADPH-dependent 2,4-dienoyl-CoA reductase/sulfur reductase-like enzyme/rhodanese-related sulfurtransferase